MKLEPPRDLYCPECKRPFQPLGFGHMERCPVGRRYLLPQVAPGHRVLVFGSRLVPVDRHADITQALDRSLAEHPDLAVMHGFAQGADSLAADWAAERGVAVERWPAQWKLFPPWLAPLWRNAEMAARKPHEGLAFIGPCTKYIHKRRIPHGSHGSVDMALRLRAEGVPVIPVTWDIPENLAEFLSRKEEG